MLTETEARDRVRKHALSKGRGPKQIVYEFWLPRSNVRADVTIIGETIEAFEIKTARDNLSRLPRQIDAYSHIFDLCNAVVAEKHLEQTLDLLPQWWGVLIFDAESELRCVRTPCANGEIDPETLVRLLWRQEAYAALNSLGESPDPDMRRSRLWEQLLSILHLDALRDVVRHALLTRDPERATIPTRRFT